MLWSDGVIMRSSARCEEIEDGLSSVALNTLKEGLMDGIWIRLDPR